jgi:hypothetical protein
VVAIELHRRSKQKKDIVKVPVTPGIDANSEFDFGKVKKGWNVKITVAEPEKQPFASSLLRVREFELDNALPVELSLTQEKEVIGTAIIVFDRTLS